MEETTHQDLFPTGGLTDPTPDTAATTSGDSGQQVMASTEQAADTMPFLKAMDLLQKRYDQQNAYDQLMLRRREEDLEMKRVLLRREEEDVEIQRTLLRQKEKDAEEFRQLISQIRRMGSRQQVKMADTVHAAVRDELLRSHLVTSDVPQPPLVLKEMTMVLKPWLTRCEGNEQLFSKHFTPIIGERKVWMEADKVCVHANYLSKFVRALFHCMDEFHLSAFRNNRVETSIQLRLFLEHSLVYKKGERTCPLHVMVPIERAISQFF